MFSIIAAVGKNRELGKDGGLVFRIKEDMQFFKRTTMGHKVVMGKKTWESLPGKLPGRENVVVAFQGEVPGADRTVNDLETFIEEEKDSPEEIFVIGGGRIYTEFLNAAKRIYLTEIEATAEADTFFPDFDKSEYKKEILGKGQENGVNYQFVKYEK